MELLRAALCLSLALPLAAGAAHSQDGEPFDAHEVLVQQQAKSLCNSTDEYIKTLKFLRSTKEIILPERTSRLTAERVSKGCDGAAERFEKILLLMKASGLSDPKSLEIALKFAGYSRDVQKNFSEIFSRAFLSEFFDYDYALAVGLALELSRDYKGEPAQVRDDFIYLAQLCKDSKTLDLASKPCAEYAVKVAKLSQIYPEGIRGPFAEFYKKMREDRDFGFDVRTALEITYKVLRNGPRAPDNFMKAYAYAMKEDGLALPRMQALEFAVKMANRSFIGKEPPVIPPASSLNPTTTAELSLDE